jgi:hypothetical protein
MLASKMLASGKEPPLHAEDYFEASNERWREVEYLFGTSAESNGDYWLLITFLAAVYLECILTAIMLKEAGEDEPGLVTDHNLLTLLSKTTLHKNYAIMNDIKPAADNWYDWRTDLRYLSTKGWENRIKEKGKNKRHPGAPPSRKTIAEEIYSAAYNVKRAGEARFMTNTAGLRGLYCT